MKHQDDRCARLTIGLLYTLVFSSILVCLPGYSIAGKDAPAPLETVHGRGCYNYGDQETPEKALKGAKALAQEEAVRNHHVFVKSSQRVKNFQLEEDLIQTASAAMLYEIQFKEPERKAQEICISLTAKISPVSLDDMIQQRLNAKEIARDAQAVLVSDKLTFGLKVWTNKSEGRFLEGEKVVIYVQSERDAYLKLDYFQANGKVVHLVPNRYRGQAFIKGGKKYAFGDETSPEYFIVEPPYGTEAIKAIGAVLPFDTGPEGESTESDSREYIQKGLRGLKVVAATSSVEISTESRAVDAYKKDNAKPAAPQKHP
jgi:Domain of unknown function (DUF4384)